MSYYMIIEHIRKRTEKRLRGVWYEQREKTAAIFFNNYADSASDCSLHNQVHFLIQASLSDTTVHYTSMFQDSSTGTEEPPEALSA